jgi:hypothetical protein
LHANNQIRCAKNESFTEISFFSLLNFPSTMRRAAPGADPNSLAPAAPATGEDGEIVGGPR